jgi:RNA polymerase sigma-70 factor (ECF subfamily)
MMTPAFTRQSTFPLRLVHYESASRRPEATLFDLTRQMQEGVDAAWSEFHQRYYLWLLRLAATRAYHPDEAAEIVQQAYLRVARHIKPFSAEDDFRAWLSCVVRCAAMDHRRGILRRWALLERFAHWRTEAQLDSGPAGGPETSVVREALAELPAEEARLLELKYCEGWSVQELAGAEQTTPKTIENRLARLRQRLRDIILRLK